MYVRIQHATPAEFPLELTTQAYHGERVQREVLALGLAFGALLLLIVACMALSWAFRDTAFAWYGGYAALTALAVFILGNFLSLAGSGGTGTPCWRDARNSMTRRLLMPRTASASSSTLSAVR